MAKTKSEQTLGSLLQQARLVSPHQVEIALKEQKKNPQRRLGEILAQKGWIKQQTADFFAEDWARTLEKAREGTPQYLGYYLKKAGLINDSQLHNILEEQGQGRIWMRIGALAVFKGLINQTTVDFFLQHLHPNRAGDSPFLKARQ
ncbi:hypothetical protein [Crocosphaera sp. Alani8]|uniref:hypothetical protein n=1 Tax=Crocosphaera sp. Alani8 TaxID=3038952 RepID=UPI00313EA51E